MREYLKNKSIVARVEATPSGGVRIHPSLHPVMHPSVEGACMEAKRLMKAHRQSFAVFSFCCLMDPPPARMFRIALVKGLPGSGEKYSSLYVHNYNPQYAIELETKPNFIRWVTDWAMEP